MEAMGGEQCEMGAQGGDWGADPVTTRPADTGGGGMHMPAHTEKVVQGCVYTGWVQTESCALLDNLLCFSLV